jgi:hypothetical protein
MNINPTHKHIMEMISLEAPRAIPRIVFAAKIKKIRKSKPFQLSIFRPTQETKLTRVNFKQSL